MTSRRTTTLAPLAVLEFDLGALYDAQNYRPMVRHVRGKPKFLDDDGVR